MFRGSWGIQGHLLVVKEQLHTGLSQVSKQGRPRRQQTWRGAGLPAVWSADQTCDLARHSQAALWLLPQVARGQELPDTRLHHPVNPRGGT